MASLLVGEVRLHALGDNVFTKGLQQRLRRLEREEQAARRKAAQEATKVTQASFTYRRPFDAPARPGRRTTNGKFADALRWVPGQADDTNVRFDMKHANAAAPYWPVQEIGTGERGMPRSPTVQVPVGRPRNDAPIGLRPYVIPSQKGRMLPPNLVFASRAGGRYVPFGNSRGQQLYLRSQVRGAPAFDPRKPVFIHHEIHGQHMVQKGSEAGFREYHTSLLAGARAAFAGQPFR